MFVFGHGSRRCLIGCVGLWFCFRLFGLASIGMACGFVAFVVGSGKLGRRIFLPEGLFCIGVVVGSGSNRWHWAICRAMAGQRAIPGDRNV